MYLLKTNQFNKNLIKNLTKLAYLNFFNMRKTNKIYIKILLLFNKLNGILFKGVILEY